MQEFEAVGRIVRRYNAETGRSQFVGKVNCDADGNLPDWPAVQAARPSERQWIADITFQQLVALWEQVGPRHRNCTLENFETTNDAQRKAVEAFKAYRDNLVENISNGVGIVLTGPTGSGKTHLLASLFDATIQNGKGLAWTSGPMLYAAIRGTMDRRDKSETEELSKYTRPNVLVIEDPIVAAGVLTPFQSDGLFQIVDERWRHKRATWVSLNVANRREAEAKLGPAIVDRLVDGALTIACGWPSYRKAVKS